MPHNNSTYENNKCLVLKHNTQFNLVLILGKKIWKRKHLLIKKALLSIATEVLYAVYLRTAIT